MAKTGVRDSYSNKFYGSVTESAANTLTFSEINTNVNIFDKVAWILNRLEWFLPSAALGELAQDADSIDMALTSSNSITALSLSDPSVIDLMTLETRHSGTAGSAWFFDMPLIRDFSNMPGGGLIIAPRPLYIAVKGTALASAVVPEVRGHFQSIELKADEYLELVDFYRIVS